MKTMYEDMKMLDAAAQHIARRRYLEAARQLRMFIDDNPHLGVADEVERIGEDYRLLLLYMMQGYADPQRDEVLENIRRRLFAVVQNLRVAYKRLHQPLYVDALQRARKYVFSHDRIRQTLENHVADMAMLSLEAEELQAQKRLELNKEHQQFMSSLFCHVLVSQQWTDADRLFYSQLVLSPVVDAMDAQLIVSAVTLSAINIYDANKLQMLVETYRAAADEVLRQRALVGWVFAWNGDEPCAEPWQRGLIRDVCRQPQTARELADMQKQLVFCLNAEKDKDEIQREIIPTLMKNNNFNITREGIITEKEDDELEDILHPDAADRRMEEVEESVQRMVNMQKAGSDIYFGGFSQMKRFPFFYDISNWFCPFYIDHPGIAKVMEKLRSTGLIQNMAAHGSFCESDKYSLALAMSSVVERLPQNLREMLGNAEALGPVVEEHERQDAAYIRRSYLQDMYRFFKLYPQQGQMRTPKAFSAANCLFIAEAGFSESPLAESYADMSVFFIKQGRHAELAQLWQGGIGAATAAQALFIANYLIGRQRNDEAVALLEQFLQDNAADEKLRKMLARAHFAAARYAEATEIYARLCADNPQNASYAMNYGVSLSRCDRFDEAEQLFYRLSFEHPSANATRGLAWALMGNGKMVQAEKEYGRLLNGDDAIPADSLNAGYCQWAQGNVVQAVGFFRQFLAQMREGQQAAELEKELQNDRRMLQKLGLTVTDERLMCELVDLEEGR